MVDKLQLKSFGDYLLIDKVASGGMADVFSARTVGTRGFSKTVAIKRIYSHLAESSHSVAMFTDEAKIASRLHHPNIVQILELGEVSSRPFIAMEYVSGRDLFRIFERLKKIGEPCPWPMAVRIVLELAQALHHAHEFQSPDGRSQCIIHRDVSPRNVLVSFSGDVKLTDFGIARARDREEHTEHGQIKGKVRYMSPEAASGNEIDRRSDIFSLGVVFAELLTMEPFRGGPNDLAVLLSIRDGKDNLQFDAIPTELVHVLNRALNRNPEERYPTAEAFRIDLANQATGPIAPMAALELGHFISGIFAEEHTMERRRQMEVDNALEQWHRDHQRKTLKGSAGPQSRDSTLPPNRTGSIPETSLAKLFGNLHRERQTGRLDLHRPPLKKSVFFTAGEPVFVMSNVEREAFGEYLVSTGSLTVDDLAILIKQTEQGGLQLIDLLLRSKSIAPNELYRSLSNQVCDQILDIFTWNDGTFAYFSDERPPEAGMPLNLNSLTLVTEGVMERIPLAHIRKSFHGDQNAVVRRSIFTLPKSLSLSGWDQRLLRRIEVRPSTLADLRQGESNEERTLRLIYLLRELGLVELHDS